MTSSIHPEYLFDLDRQASLTESERVLRDQHLQSCVTCRLEHGFRDDFAREALEGEDDRALLQRAMQGALTTVTLPPAPKRAPRWAVPTAIGASLLAAGLAAAALRSQRAPVASTPAPPSDVRPAPVTTPPVPGPAAYEPAPVVATSPTAERAPVRLVTNAAQLFARANAARRSGDTAEALRLYRRLLAEFATSREALTTEVTMARLLLDTQGDAAEALRLFDRYVATAPDGNLAEEARLGRADALGRLAQSAAEAAAWAELLEQFPATVHRARAEARLQQIQGAAP